MFDRLKQFHHNGRLHMILGNHDIGKDRSLTKMKLGMPLKMGARFLHEPTGREIFLTYGHQADLESGDFSRLMLRYLAMPFQKLSLQSAGTTNRVIRWLRKVTQHIENSYDEHSAVLERRIKGWAVRHAQKIIVCGHTHVPRFADGNYFNTGSCLEPGALTGIEIAHGKISQIRWLKTDEGKMQKLILNEMSLAQ
ncbi:MAG: metallophosphoesterase [Chloroflexota bacterium]